MGKNLACEVQRRGCERAGDFGKVFATHQEINIFGGAGGTGVNAADPRGDGVATDHGVTNAGAVKRGGRAGEPLLDAVHSHDMSTDAHRVKVGWGCRRGSRSVLCPAMHGKRLN